MNALAFAASRGALVLKEVKIEEGSDNPVHIVARKAGFIAWVLSLIGIDPTTIFDVYTNRIEFVEGSLSGKMRHMIPLKSVCNLGTGYFKPILCFFFAVLLLFFSITAAFSRDVPGIMVFILLLAAVACIAAYYLKKTLIVFALPASGLGAVISVKRSVIEGVAMDEEQAERIVSIISGLIQKSNA